MSIWHKIQDKLTYVRIIALGYMVVIMLGTLFLMIPAATAEGRQTDFFTALFTAASSACVTGMGIVDIGSHFSLLGQVGILVMIQVGGLGFVTMGVLLAMVLKQKITLRTRELLQESMNGIQVGGIVRLIRFALKGTLVIEAVGTVLLAIRFAPQFGVAKGLWYSLFHSISAYCNAGIDLLGAEYGEFCSLIAFQTDVWINIVFMLLIIVGGIGFFVWADLKEKHLQIRKYSLHTKMALFMTGVLLIVGTVLYFLFENQNLLADMNTGEKLLAACFGSVTVRTAGFSTISVAGMTNASKLLTMVLMFIGGSPGSVSGGVKTVTVLVLLTYVWSNLRGSKSVNIFSRRLDDDVIRKASNVVIISILLAITASILLCFMEPQMIVTDVLLEVFAAISTTGMSAGLTRQMGMNAQIVILILMYCGRIGSMAFALSFTERKKIASVKLPAEKIMIG